MGIACGCLYLAVTKQSSDDRQSDTLTNGDAGGGVSEIVNTNIRQASLFTDQLPGLCSSGTLWPLT